MNRHLNRKMSTVVILGLHLTLYERNAKDYFETFEQIESINSDVSAGVNTADGALRIALVNCSVISQSIAVYYNDLRWWAIIKKFKVGKLLFPLYLYENLTAHKIIEYANKVLELDGLTPAAAADSDPDVKVSGSSKKKAKLTTAQHSI